MALEKFSSQADEELLREIRELADKEGAKFYALVNEAFETLLEKRRQSKPRKTVMDYFESSINEYDHLYEKLAK